MRNLLQSLGNYSQFFGNPLQIIQNHYLLCFKLLFGFRGFTVLNYEVNKTNKSDCIQRKYNCYCYHIIDFLEFLIPSPNNRPSNNMNNTLGTPNKMMVDFSCMSLKRAEISTAVAKYLAISINHFPNSFFMSHKTKFIPRFPSYPPPASHGSSVSASCVRVPAGRCGGV